MKKSRRYSGTEKEYNKPSRRENTLPTQDEIQLLKIMFAWQLVHQRPPGIPLRGRSRCEETCSERRSCRQSRACPPHVSYRGTGKLAHLPGTFSDMYRRFGRGFCVGAVSRALWWEHSLRCACRIHPRRDQRPQSLQWRCGRGKRRTSPISAISCAAVVSPTPYMARTVSYSGSWDASRVISARRVASVILPAKSCCAAVTMSSFVFSFFGSVVKWPQLAAYMSSAFSALKW